MLGTSDVHALVQHVVELIEEDGFVEDETLHLVVESGGSAQTLRSAQWREGAGSE